MKKTLIAIGIGVLIIAISVALAFDSKKTSDAPVQHVVSMVDGTQIIDIRAKAGFQPQEIVATAGVPTILRVTTKGTFDCSSSIRIPSLNISKNLTPTGVSDIDLGTPSVGTMNGSCGMGMYPFKIQFQ